MSLWGRVIINHPPGKLAVQTIGSGASAAGTSILHMRKRRCLPLQHGFQRPGKRSRSHGAEVSTMLTGGDKQRPGAGEDPVYLICNFDKSFARQPGRGKNPMKIHNQAGLRHSHLQAMLCPGVSQAAAPQGEERELGRRRGESAREMSS